MVVVRKNADRTLDSFFKKLDCSWSPLWKMIGEWNAGELTENFRSFRIFRYFGNTSEDIGDSNKLSVAVNSYRV